jgi:hypothetical protein
MVAQILVALLGGHSLQLAMTMMHQLMNMVWLYCSPMDPINDLCALAVLMLVIDLKLRPQEISKVGTSEGSSQIYKIV